MPAPLAIPPIRTALPSMLSSTAISFLWLSLVMIATAASAALRSERASNGAQDRIPRSTFFIGIGTPIRPVEQTRTSLGDRPRDADIFVCVPMDLLAIGRLRSAGRQAGMSASQLQ